MRSSFGCTLELAFTNDIYFASQMNCRYEILDFSVHRNKPQRRCILNGCQKGIMLCKLFHRASFAMALIFLSGDIELTPGFQTFKDIKSTRGLKIAHLNIRSLRNKTDALRLEGIDNKTIDILTLSETWLSDSISDTEIELPGFACVRLDRTGVKKGYGGVAIYIREGLSFRLRDDIDTGGHECLWIELIRDICKPTIICCAYRAPDVDLEGFIPSLQSSVPEINFEKSDVILLGDLNVNTMPNSGQSKKTNNSC